MKLTLITLVALVVGVMAACGSSTPSTPSRYEDILLSCSTVSPALEAKSHKFSETSGRVECHGGEKQSTTDSPAGGGTRPRALNFAMFVNTLERPPSLSLMKGQIGRRDNTVVIKTPNTPWNPPAVVDDYLRAEYRNKQSLKTENPSVSYEIRAVVGNTLLGVSTTDYAAYIGREFIPGISGFDD